MAAAYEAGVKAALESYGLHRGMPHGPEHLGAERFARRLQGERESFHTRGAGPATRSSRLNRPTLWGDKMPMDSGSMATQAHAGLSPYGGV